MSAYGAMSKAGGYGDEGGGFDASSQQGSQGGQKNYQDESLRPVTIKQILDAEESYGDNNFKIDGTTISQVTAVGQVRSFNAQPTNITIRIDDGTGSIEVKKFIDIDKQAEAQSPGYEVDSHVRIWGPIKSYSGKRYVTARLIRPVKDFNEVNYHMLESTFVHLHYTKGPLGGQNNGGQNGDSMFVDSMGTAGNNSASNGKLGGVSAGARKMYKYLESIPNTNEGVNINLICQNTGMTHSEVLGGSDELLGQGLIYTTIDDETWAILEY